MKADYEVCNNIAVITLNNPPGNHLVREMRKSILERLDAAAGNPAIETILLTGAAGVFSRGWDITELANGNHQLAPSLATVIREIEQSSKPVIAAIEGDCTGEGLELAMGCHYRVAAASAQIGLPQVKLGLLPAAGGTQRLPRLVGLEKALNMIVSGELLAAEELRSTGLFDELLEGDVIAAAVAFAGKVARHDGKLPRARDLKIVYPNIESYIGFARRAVNGAGKNLPAAVKCVDAVAASVNLDFDEGLKRESELFHELAATSEANSLIYAARAEKTAAVIPDVPAETPVRAIKKAAVIGAGTMGTGIAMNFLNAGIPVTLLEANGELLDKGVATIRGHYENSMKRKRLTPAVYEERMGRLSTALEYTQLADADIVIEAVFEEMEVKKAVFEKLDACVKPGAILATNTSTLDVNRIAQFTRRPHDVLGTHFFSPANVMRLLEVVRGTSTAKDVLATVIKLAETLNKTPVVAGVCDGFIGNRMLDPYRRQAYYMLGEGCMPEQIDKAIEKFGFAMGPFRMHDLAGNDVSWRSRKRRYVERPEIPALTVPDRLCEMGRFGQKTGAGWYDYKPGDRNAYPSAAVHELIENYRKERGFTARKISADEIVERMVFALVNEGARILEEGIASRPSDIDVIYVMGYGFPAWRGGPMFYADSVGLYDVVRSMKRFSGPPHGDPGCWEPAPLLGKMAAEGKKLREEWC